MANARLPSFSMSFTTGSRCSSLRLATATSAPARANSTAMDLPMPVPPPVMIAVLPSSENGDVVMAGTIPQRARRSRAGLVRQRDLGLPARHLALYAPPHDAGRERRAVELRARVELLHQDAHLVGLTPRRLRRTTHLVVRRALRFHPRLLEMRHQQREPLRLRIDVAVPRRARRKALAARR